MKEAMETAIGEQTAEQFRKIEYLNIIGNLGPLLGLLGTVLGMIEAFQDLMAAGGDANPAKLAGGISTALCHTFLGLFLAVPCLAALRRAADDRRPADGRGGADRRRTAADDQAGRGQARGRRRRRPVRPGATPQPAPAPRRVAQGAGAGAAVGAVVIESVVGSRQSAVGSDAARLLH